MIFDPEKLTIIWDGYVITGYAQGSTVNVARNNDDVTPSTGLKGDTVYALNADRSGTVTFNLFPESASIGKLRRDAQNRKASTLTVRNANGDGGFIVQHNDCRILKVPDYIAGSEPQSVEVRIFVPVMNFN